MFDEAIEFIKNIPPFELSVNGVRNIPEIVEYYEATGYTCEILPDDADGIRKMKVS